MVPLMDFYAWLLVFSPPQTYENCSSPFVPRILKESFRVIYERFCILYIYHCQIALHYHLSMVCTCMSKEAAIFVAIGKMLKIHMLICPFLSFYNHKINFKCWVLLFYEILSFPTAQISFSSPSPIFEIFKIWILLIYWYHKIYWVMI